LSKPYKLQIPRHLHDAMLAQARAVMPHECCGLLAGTIRDDVAGAAYWFPLVNVAKDRATEYRGDDRGALLANRIARALGMEIIAIYHSHPTSAPLPSRKDREMSVGWGDAVVHLIISLAAGEPAVRAWRLTATDATEAEWEVVTESA
jgi:proteasome lid subunit RPN8/RPN11